MYLESSVLLEYLLFLNDSLFVCSFSHAYIIFPGCIFVCGHFSIVDIVSGEAVTVQRAVFFYAAVA